MKLAEGTLWLEMKGVVVVPAGTGPQPCPSLHLFLSDTPCPAGLHWPVGRGGEHLAEPHNVTWTHQVQFWGAREK